MLNIILADEPKIHSRLLPLTFTRPVSHLLTGMQTNVERWQALLPGLYSYRTASYLKEIFPETPAPDSIIIYSHIIPDDSLAKAVGNLAPSEKLLLPDGSTAAFRLHRNDEYTTIPYPEMPLTIDRPYHLFQHNHLCIPSDFTRITGGRRSMEISRTNIVIGDRDLIFIEKGAKVEGAFLNTSDGPIYIGACAEVMEGSCLRGPIAIMEHSVVNMGTKLYGASTIGAHCKIGGELNNVVIHPYSNKAHDGFLGNAVIGSWCNIGAGCVASNLKNDYTEIKLWDYESRRFLRTGLQFCGLIMGDHSKAGINTMFNTATVTGVGVNIHGTGFPRNFVASFSEGSATAGFTDVPLSKFFNIASRMMARRGIELNDADRRLYENLHEITETYK